MYKSVLKLVALFLVLFSSTIYAQFTTPTQEVCHGATGKTYSVDTTVAEIADSAGSIYTWTITPAAVGGGLGFAGTITDVASSTVFSTNTISGVGTNRISVDWGATPAGSYDLSVAETNTACPATNSTVTVTVTNVTATVSMSSATICQSDAVSITATPTPALTAGHTYTYNWTVPPGVTASGNVASFSPSPITAGGSVAGPYSVVITDECGNHSPAATQVTLTVNPSPKVTISNSGGNPCAGNVFTLTAVPTHTLGTVSYKWKIGGIDISPAEIGSTCVVSTVGNYTVEITDSGNTSCPTATSLLPVTVTINPLPVIGNIRHD